MNFGEHLTIDGYRGDFSSLNDEKIVRDLLTELPEKLGMHRLNEPVVVSAPENDVKDPGGWSGFVIIAESHISIHTFPKRGFVSADVYTCRPGLDVQSILDSFARTFNLQEIEHHFIKRGTKYPAKNIQ